MTDFHKKTPCNDCPYRKDAPLQLWSIEEFKDLTYNDQTQFGTIYGCHKKDGHTCVGWLMDQDKRGFPSIALRLSLSKNNVNREYLDALYCKTGLYASIKQMCIANYPKHFKK